MSVRARLRAPGWSSVAILGVMLLGVAAYVLVYTIFQRPGRFPVDSDGQGYYAYLPAYLVYHDPSFKAVLAHNILPMYGNALPPKQFGFSLQQNGFYLDKYGVGVAILLLPFFLVGYALAIATGQTANGYSLVEMFTVGAGAIVYTGLGLLMLRAVLRRWFSEPVVAITLVALVLGTGVLVYLSWLPTINHDFAFFALCAVLLCTVRWLERPASALRAVLLGLAMGMVLAIRLTDVVLLLAVPVFGAGSLAALRARARLVAAHVRNVAVACACTLLPLVPQVATWFIATGHLITRPYPGEPFYFTHPALLQSLLWFRPHGLLPYYPVAGVALAALAVAWFRRRDIALPVTLALVPFWYLVSAWWDWSFSSAFGDRAYIDIMPLLGLPLAYALTGAGHAWLRRGVRTVTVVLVLLTCYLTVVYFERRMPQDGIDAGGYLTLLEHPGRLLHGSAH